MLVTFNHSFTADLCSAKGGKAAHEKDKTETLKRCMGLIHFGSIQKLFTIVAEPERIAVIAAGAVLVQCFLVFPGGVTLVLRPVVAGKLMMQFFHVVVAVGFCENTGSGNGGIKAITLDDAFMRDLFKRDEPVSIDQQ